MPGMGVRRDPVPAMGGLNTFQPRFRVKPGNVMASTPMSFQPKVVGRYGYGGVRPTSFHQGMRGFVPPPPIFIGIPRSSSYDEKDNEEQMYEEEYECNTSCICNKCEKEF